MSLNNKYLAIGLSIAAVLIVVYQVFINKPETPAPTQPQTQQQIQAPAPPMSSTSSTGPTEKTGGSGGGEGLVIDYNAPALLKRILPEMAQPYPKSELIQSFGVEIFTKREVEKETPKQVPIEPEIEFKLNAIIIDQTRNIAVINDKILKVGDFIQGAEVKSIVKSRVVLQLGKDEITLSTNSRVMKLKLVGGKGEK